MANPKQTESKALSMLNGARPLLNAQHFAEGEAWGLKVHHCASVVYEWNSQCNLNRGRRGEEAMAHLGLIVSNYRPFREDRDPRTWLLYKDKKLIDVMGPATVIERNQLSMQKG